MFQVSRDYRISNNTIGRDSRYHVVILHKSRKNTINKVIRQKLKETYEEMEIKSFLFTHCNKAHYQWSR